jgi:hypothetical protein
MSVSVDWKPERAVHAKLETWTKMIILIDWKPARAIYAKVKDHDKVTASVSTIQLGHTCYQRTSDSKHLQIKDSEQGQFKVVREHNSYCVQCTFPYIYHFPKFSKIRGATPLVGHHSIHQIWACAHLFGTLIYSICKNFFYFLWQYLKQKKNQK